jgi:hypothetical protein
MTRAELLAEVRRWPEAMREDFEERAAIMAEGCRLSCEESERNAYALLKPRVPLKQQATLELGAA